MIKKLLPFVIVICSFVSVKAIDPFLEFQPVQAGGGFTAFNFQCGITGKVHPYIRLGGGLGITERWNFDTRPLIPIFARGQIEGHLGSLDPFFSFDVGYEINTEETSCGAVLINPMVGLKFGKWYFGIGYLGHCWTSDYNDSTNTFNMKIGYSF